MRRLWFLLMAALAVCGFVVPAPALAETLAVAYDTSWGLSGAALNVNPGVVGLVTSDALGTWTQTNLMVFDQEVVDERYCATFSGGALRCKDLSNPAAVWQQVAHPQGASFGPDTRLTLAGAGIDPLIDVLTPTQNGLVWANWDGYFAYPGGPGPWASVLPGVSFSSDAKIDSRGTAACAATNDSVHDEIRVYCDWEGTRRWTPPALVLAVPLTHFSFITGLRMATDFAVVTYGAMGAGYTSVVVTASGLPATPPAALGLVTAISDFVYYRDAVGVWKWSPTSNTLAVGLGYDPTYYGSNGTTTAFEVWIDPLTGLRGPLISIP